MARRSLSPFGALPKPTREEVSRTAKATAARLILSRLDRNARHFMVKLKSSGDLVVEIIVGDDVLISPEGHVRLLVEKKGGGRIMDDSFLSLHQIETEVGHGLTVEPNTSGQTIAGIYQAAIQGIHGGDAPEHALASAKGDPEAIAPLAGAPAKETLSANPLAGMW